jgi:hypothetical protein
MKYKTVSAYALLVAKVACTALIILNSFCLLVAIAQENEIGKCNLRKNFNRMKMLLFTGPGASLIPSSR